MKRFVCLTCAYLIVISGFAQNAALFISTDKTTSLVFPFSIRHVDRGTKDILVQQVKEADNILLVKASIKDFTETNLSVLTDDGTVYTFVMNYEEKPAIWVYNLAAYKQANMVTYANGILDNPLTLRGVNNQSWGIHAAVIGAYIKDDIIYYQLRIKNTTPLNYDIEMLRFYIRDKKNGKRTAVQEIELKPLHIAGNIASVKAFYDNTIVVALEKFTIPDKKYLGIEVMEKNGGRHLLIKMNNKKILKAIPLPDFK